MPRYVIIGLILGGVAYFIYRVINEFLGGIAGTRSAIRGDYKALEEFVDSYELEPWSYEELDLISREHDVSSKTLMYSHVEHGQFYSIYEEPILAFASKSYLNNDRRLYVIKFNENKYYFNVFEGEVELLKKKKRTGRVSLENGLSVSLDNRQAKIEPYSSNSGLIPLLVDQHHKLSIAAADEHVGLAGRMLHKIEGIDIDEGELIVLTIAFALADKQI